MLGEIIIRGQKMNSLITSYSPNIGRTTTKSNIDSKRKYGKIKYGDYITPFISESSFMLSRVSWCLNTEIHEDGKRT